MRLALLTALTMTSFAANSVLNRLALKGGAIGAMDFACIRVVAGCLALVLLLRLTGRGWASGAGIRTLGGAATLTLYMLGFSLAYLSLDAGTGALILFGGVQITMFAGALARGETVPARRWSGAGLAFAGLTWLLWPGASDAPRLWPALSMSGAALGWGLYSLAGRGARDPIAATAANFLGAAPLTLLAAVSARLVADAVPVTGTGVALAVLSGAVTSGLGYALWYSILPGLGAARAAIAQLTVPVIAAGFGIVFLGETLTPRFALAGALVLGGVALASVPRRVR